MTEKRFVLKDESFKSITTGIIDNDCDYFILNSRTVLDLLNALHEENEQLRKDREDLFYRERDTKNKWRELKQENEQLQSRIKDYDVALRRLQDLTDKKLKENDELKNKLNLILEKKYHEFIDGDIGNFKIKDLEFKE